MHNDIIFSMGTYTYMARIKWIDEEGGYYFVEFPSLKGCITYGHTLEEAIEMAKDALRCWISTSKEIGWSIPHEKSALKKRQRKLALPLSVSIA